MWFVCGGVGGASECACMCVCVCVASITFIDVIAEQSLAEGLNTQMHLNESATISNVSVVWTTTCYYLAEIHLQALIRDGPL